MDIFECQHHTHRLYLEMLRPGKHRQDQRLSLFCWNTFLSRELVAAGLDEWCEVLLQGCLWSPT